MAIPRVPNSSALKPLAVTVKDTQTLLSCSHQTVYDLIAAGELDSFLDGRIRKVVYDSVERYVERRRASKEKSGRPAKALATRMARHNARAASPIAAASPARPVEPHHAEAAE